jgi:Dienelactone hydrolase family
MIAHPTLAVRLRRTKKPARFHLHSVFALMVVFSWFAMPSALAADGTAPPLKDSLPPLKNGVAPRNSEELWAGYDPSAEPLDVQILKEWEQDGVVLKVLRYRVGVFKGRKAMIAAVYGHPKGTAKIPGLVQIHGGGQFAQFEAVLTNAKRGYATISIAWAGRYTAPGYAVGPKQVKLFWDGKTTDPEYKLTTDWGAIDAYHSPCRFPENSFQLNPPSDHSIDPVASPRNSGWFPCVMAARRALTFLEQQPEVDAGKLGIYGHSMGGKLSVLTAGIDKRVKAAAPSCGGISDRSYPDAAYRATLSDDLYLKNITCPIVFLSPANDFHGRINDIQKAVKEIRSTDWRVTCSPHHNHQDTPEYEVATHLCFDHYLKGTFKLPATPQTELALNAEGGVPVLTVRPDATRPVLRVDVFYTQQGQIDGLNEDFDNTKNRFWHHAATIKRGDAWVAELPLHSIQKPLWVYANVSYPLDLPVSGAGYYYRLYQSDRFNLSSLMHMVTPTELKAAAIRATIQPSLLIESFEGDWEKEWFNYKPDEWTRATHKLHDDPWQAPAGARLAIEVLSESPNKLVVGIDGHAAEVELTGGFAWQAITLDAGDFKDAAGTARLDWSAIKELRLAATDRLTLTKDGKEQQLQLGATWKGAHPKFRNLRWVPAGAK